ncbi:Exportin-6 [Hypsibius exemplaris]|uniref:Exportin-6 n=1 Tax=Hypsibius exemplaris TaxID=2072580 RepID=A0A1W0X612_HYPEX|nr:Exportin-6 [Hypsibius exemplaris]
MEQNLDHELLRTAEALFAEFYHGGTSNARKAAIEMDLKSLLGDPKHWRTWTDALAATQNQFVIMQCLNLLGDFVANFWATWATTEQKEYIKNRLLHYLDQSGNFQSSILAPSPLPNFVVTKLMKLVVDIGRSDWPGAYPNFFDHIEELVRDPRRSVMGLRMLKLVSEEFMHPKEDLRRSRKDELKNGLTQRVPVIFGLLHGVLQPFLDVMKGGSALPVDAQKALVARCVDALQVLNDILTWIPAKYYLPPELLSALFSFANCDPDNLDVYEVATVSLSCIGEIAGKSCPTPDVEKTLWSVYEFTFVKLEKVSQDLQGVSELSDSSSEYYQQFVELLRPLIVNHLQRFESHQGFPTMNFLERFFLFCFHMPAFDLFLSCVDIWNDFLDRILAMTSSRASLTRTAILQTYSAPILALVDRLLMRIQIHFNLEQLEELSEELHCQVDGVSERDDYFQRCIGVIIKAGEILPREVLGKLLTRFGELQQAFGRIQSLLQIVTSGSERKVVLSIEKKIEIRQLHCVLRDLGIVSRATASLCGLLTGDLYNVYSDQVIAVVQALLQGVQFFSDSLNCLRNFETRAPLLRDFVYLHAALYQSLESLFPWLTQFYSTNVHGSSDGLNTLVAAVIKTCLDPILSQADPSVASSSSKTLRSLTKIIRIPGMADLVPVKELFRQLTDKSGPGVVLNFWSLATDTQIHLLCALSNVFVLPLNQQPQEGENGWQTRANQHAKLLAALTDNYRALTPNNEATVDVVNIVKSILNLMNGLLLNTAEDPKKSRQIVLASLNPFLNSTLALLPSFKKNPEQRSAVLTFILNVFSSLKSAFPPELTSPLSDLFEGLFEQFLDPDELLAAFRSSDPVQMESLSTCFDLLKLVVGDPAYKSYLPMVIMLCHIVCPALQNLSDIRIEFRTASYELLLSILTHHWSYFFRSVRMVATATNGDGVETSVKEEAAEAKDFLIIMQSMGAALLQPEISVTQLVLEGLNRLSVTRQIFRKTPFQQALRADYLNALLSMLVNKEKQLLSEEIVIALFSIVSPDPYFFYQQYLPSFLELWPGLDDVQRRRLHGDFAAAPDWVTEQLVFVEQIKSLTGEIRCFVLYNSLKAK